jgi:hypothetical protein
MISPYKLLTLLFLGLSILFACNKPTLDDEGLLPDDQLGLVYTDTFSVVAEVVLVDSVRADELAVNLWGAMNDPVFGKSYGGVYFQMSTDRNNVDFGDNLTLDSVVLTLLYSGEGYGDLTVPQNMNIYRVTEQFYKDTAYHQFDAFLTDPTPLATLNGFVPNFTDSLTINDSVKYAPGLRIRLDDVLGNDILANSGENNLASDAAFKAFLNGLYLAPDTNAPGSGLVYFDLFTANSKLTLYYNNGESFDFLINSNSGSVNRFRHDFIGTPVLAAVTDGNANDEVLYVQPMAGVKVKVTIPYIGNLGPDIAINKAELVFTDIGDTSVFAAPTQLLFTETLEGGAEDLIADLYVSTGFAGGGRTTETDGQGNVSSVYKLNIPRYLQKVVSTGVQYGLNLLPFPTARQANRVVLGGSTHGQSPLKLRLTYTKIE